MTYDGLTNQIARNPGNFRAHLTMHCHELLIRYSSRCDFCAILALAINMLTISVMETTHKT